MLLQLTDITNIEWIFAIALIFGMPLVMSFLTGFSFEGYLAWMGFFDVFLVWKDLMPLWTLVAILLFVSILLFVKLKGTIRGGV